MSRSTKVGRSIGQPPVNFRRRLWGRIRRSTRFAKTAPGVVRSAARTARSHPRTLSGAWCQTRRANSSSDTGISLRFQKFSGPAQKWPAAFFESWQSPATGATRGMPPVVSGNRRGLSGTAPCLSRNGSSGRNGVSAGRWMPVKRKGKLLSNGSTKPAAHSAGASRLASRRRPRCRVPAAGWVWGWHRCCSQPWCFATASAPSRVELSPRRTDETDRPWPRPKTVSR